MINLIHAIACGICEATGGCKPKPVPVITPAGTIDVSLASSILLDKLEEMGDDKADIKFPDAAIFKVYDKAAVKQFLKLDETDKIVYVPETQDCDDFAAELFGKGFGLVWSNLHALNWFIDIENKFWFIEPQSDKIAPNLENWQGWEISFFLGR